jgi:hypothetical protein
MKKPYVIKKKRLFKGDTEVPFRISRTQIEAFVECPRCFYFNHRYGIRRPDGPPYTINNLVDSLLKKEFDAHRLARTAHPIMTKYELDVVPFQHVMIDEWRENFKGMTWLDPRTNLLITGAIDDIWQQRCDSKLIVVDYKATGKKSEITLDHTLPKNEWIISYKRQMEIYTWLLRKQDLDVDDRGFFLFAQGRHDGDGFDQKIEFDVSLLPYAGNCDWIEPVLLDIKACLMQPSLPPAPADCEYCGYIAAAKRGLK